MPGELSQLSLATCDTGLKVQGRTARVATVLMYLNDDATLVGGETAFPQVGTLYLSKADLLCCNLEGYLTAVLSLVSVRMTGRY